MNRSKVLLSFIILLILTSCSLYRNDGIIPTGENAQEASDILHFLETKYFISDPTYNFGYAKPYPKSTELQLYKIKDKHEQDRIIRFLKKEKNTRQWKTIVVKFYEDENLIVKGNTTTRSLSENRSRSEGKLF